MFIFAYNEPEVCMKKILSFVLVFITIGIFFNNNVYRHFHKLPNGLLIEHAHPYKSPVTSPSSLPASNLPCEKHHHSNLEYLILDSVFCSGLVIVLGFFSLISFLESKYQPALLRPVLLIVNTVFPLPFLRAPPVI